MAVVIVQEAEFGSTAGDEVDPYTATLASDTVAGNMVIIIVSADTTVVTPTGFTLDRSEVNSNAGYIWTKDSVAETSSWDVDINGAFPLRGWVAEVSGLTSGVDQVQSAQSGADNDQTTGTTGTTDTADEWLVATIGQSNSFQPPNATMAGWTNSFVEQVDTPTTKTSGTNVGFGVALRTVSSTGTFETTADFLRNVASTGIIATYRIAAAAVYPPFPRRQNTLVRM